MILTICGLAVAALTGLLVWRAATRWWHYLVIAAASVALMRPVVRHLTGDVSRYLPASLFSSGADGKDEIVLASAFATVVLAVLFAALGFWAVRLVWEALRRGAK